MKTPFIVAAFVLLLISCSKPAQESASLADSTATVTNTQQPGTISTENLKPASLTAAEADRVGIEIFMRLRSMYMYEDAGGVAYKEEFDLTGNKFHYTLLRHNADNAGWSEDEPSVSYRQATDEEIEEWKADSTNVGDPPLQIAYTQSGEKRYTMEIDTFYVEGTYEVFEDPASESSVKNILCKLTGTVTIQNNQMEQYSTEGEPYSYSLGSNGKADVFGISLGSPLTFETGDLYVKAKIRELTDDDLKGIDKDQLTFVRNDIFARHGHTFKTAKMIDHYGQAGWYHAVIDDAVSLLNKFEKKNVEFIKKKEG